MRIGFAVGWFPEQEWAKALERWPELAEEMPREYDGYVREVQQRLLRFPAPPGMRLFTTPLDVDGLVAHAEAHAEAGGEGDPGSSDARGQYAAELLRAGKGEPWPPARNARCWCGSGRKYKVCCALVSAEPAPAGDTGVHD
ncbi:MAG: SEC-C domain-containing protein [Acidimicrobiales bacterium]